MKRCSVFVVYADPQTSMHHVRIYERVIQTLHRFTAEYFLSLDYNPDRMSDLSTYE